jgi:subtilisin family serine protease
MKNYSLNIERLDSREMLSLNTWGLEQIHANLAQNITKGSKDVVVAIIDSGMDTNHIALKNSVWTNPGEIPNNGVDDEGNGYIDDVNGWNFSNYTNNVNDGYGHGTHVAGIVVQVAPNISVMPLKFINDRGIGDTGGAIRAIQYVVMMKEHYGINIVAVNASWGGGIGYSNMLSESIENLNKDNIAFVAAAGNSARNTDIVQTYPSCYSSENVISVGAFSVIGDKLAAFSNYGKNTVDLGSPGSVIYSTLPNNRYGYLSGTSMAAPFVTGTIGLMKSANCELTVSDIKWGLLASVTKIEGLSQNTVSGGCLDANNAIRLSLGLTKTEYPVEKSTFDVNINKVSGEIKRWFPSGITVVINGREVKNFEATGKFSEPLQRRMFRRGWNNVDIYENGNLVLRKRVRRIV